MSHAALIAARRLTTAFLCALITGCASLPPGGLGPPSTAIPGSQETSLGRIASASSEAPELSGFRLLPSGPFALSARLELSRRAEQTLDLQYFLVGDDATGRAMLRALRDAGRRGVRVRLLLDDLHTSGQDLLLAGLAAHHNVEVRLFNPFPARRGGVLSRYAASLPQFEGLNHRMHNKLFIADGVMAVTGGRNVADEYFSRHSLANFIDLDVFASGAIVGDLAKLFDDYWNSPRAYPVHAVVKTRSPAAALQSEFDAQTRSATPPALLEADVRDALGYEPIEVELSAGKLNLIWDFAEAFADDPTKGMTVVGKMGATQEAANRVRASVVQHIHDAQSEVLLVSPYFIPGKAGMSLFREARGRGISLRVLTNSLASTDQPIVHGAYRRYRRELLALGVELYELSPIKAGRKTQRFLFGTSVGGLHTKALVLDRKEVFVGSMNFDPRSDHFNTELGLFIHSPSLALETAQLISLATLEAAHRLRLDPTGRIEWTTSAAAGDEVHTEEPEASLWMRLWLELVAPLSPESLL